LFFSTASRPPLEHTASHRMGTGDSSAALKWPSHQAYHWPPERFRG